MDGGWAPAPARPSGTGNGGKRRRVTALREQMGLVGLGTNAVPLEITGDDSPVFSNPKLMFQSSYRSAVTRLDSKSRMVGGGPADSITVTIDFSLLPPPPPPKKKGGTKRV